MRMRRPTMPATVTAILAAAVAGCSTQDPQSGRGFRLPDGDAAAGKVAFVDLGCYVCHQVEGVEQRVQGQAPTTVPLGGDVTRVRSYGELVTAIINPSHRLAPGYPATAVSETGGSLMADARLNDYMTVRQLVDLVAFLQPKYRVVPPQFNPYVYVYP